MIKILYVDDVFTFGGGEKHILFLLDRIDRAKYDVSVACRKGSLFLEKLKSLNVKVEHIRFRHKFDCVGAFKFFILLLKNRYDIVNLQDNRSHWLGAFACFLAGTPVVIATVHMVNALRREKSSLFSKPILALADRIWAFMVDCIITISRYNKRALVREGIDPSKIKVIYNGIEPVCRAEDDAVNPEDIRKAFNIADDVLIIGTAARLSRQKGLSYLIEAAAMLKASGGKIEFLIVGEGPERFELAEYTKAKAVNDIFHFLGFQDNARSYIKAFDIFVLPSIYEGLPIAVIEAMMESRPVIASSAGAIDEMITDNVTGIIIPPKDSNAIAEAIKKLIAEPRLRAIMGEKAGHIARERFSVETMADETFSLYEKLAKKR